MIEKQQPKCGYCGRNLKLATNMYGDYFYAPCDSFGCGAKSALDTMRFI